LRTILDAASMTPRHEANFFAALRLANGTFKTTADHRMDDLNEYILMRWRKTAFRPTKIMDVGVSSGITSAEWVELLLRSGLPVRLTATDLALWGDIVPLWPGVSVVEVGEHILQYRVFGVSLRPWRRRLDFVTGYAFVSALANIATTYRRSHIKHVPNPVLLVSPRAQRHAAIKWAEDDVFAQNPAQFIGRFDAIRAANILNRDYFNEYQLRRAVANLKDRLAGPNARLIANRTLRDGSNHATMFRLTEANCFEAEARFGQGSEIEGTILSA